MGLYTIKRGLILLFFAIFISLAGCGGSGSDADDGSAIGETDGNSDYSNEGNNEANGDGELSDCSPLSGNNIFYVDKNSGCGSCDDTRTRDANSIETPWCSINAGIELMGSGDTLVVKAGTYYETVNLPTAEASTPFTFRSYPNERVILSGARQITDWQADSENVYVATISWLPKVLFVDTEPQTLAREPDEGFWSATSVYNDPVDNGTNIIYDTNHLSTFSEDLSGATIFVWTDYGQTQFWEDIVSLSNNDSSVSFIKSSSYMQLNGGDQYWFENQPSLIDQPGEWAVVENGDQYQIYFWPPQITDLNNVLGSYERTAVIQGNSIENVNIDGFEVWGSNMYGIQLFTGNNLSVSNCVVHHIPRYGLYLRELTNSSVTNNISNYNQYGVSVSHSDTILIAQNEIGHNTFDGLTVTWDSHNVTVANNYIHHHFLWGHPDNMQTYRNVTNLTIRDNLFLAGGQNIMMEETDGVEISGNVIIGSNSMSIISGHANTEDVTIAKNTISQCRYGCILFTGNDHEIYENIFLAGDSDAVFQLPEGTTYTADYNLFYVSDDEWAETEAVLHALGQWNLTLEQFQALTGEDQNSIVGNPQLANMPAYYSVIDTDRNHEMTHNMIYLAYETTYFNIGDIIELNFDGVARTITALGDYSITFTPALDSLTFREMLVANWHDNLNLQLDATPLATSPANGNGIDGGDIGSTVNVIEYQQGDFNGDGQRDIPIWSL